jgi:hypothetical protein
VTYVSLKIISAEVTIIFIGIMEAVAVVIWEITVLLIAMFSPMLIMEPFIPITGTPTLTVYLITT